MTGPDWALQKAVIDVLSAAPEIQAWLGTPARVYDRVPRHAAFPFLSLGDALTVPADTSTETGTDHLLRLHVWSRYAGQRELKEVIAAVQSVLHDGTLEPPGYYVTLMRIIDARTLREPDGLTRQAVIRLRTILEPAV